MSTCTHTCPKHNTSIHLLLPPEGGEKAFPQSKEHLIKRDMKQMFHLSETFKVYFIININKLYNIVYIYKHVRFTFLAPGHMYWKKFEF